MKFKIEVLGKIKPKQRPQLNRKTGAVYTPKATKESESIVAWMWKEADFPLLEGSILATIDIYKMIPKSMRKAERELALSGKLRPQVCARGDIDNIVKTVLDGLNEVAYNDDKQVIGLVANIWYAEENKTTIELEECDVELQINDRDKSYMDNIELPAWQIEFIKKMLEDNVSHLQNRLNRLVYSENYKDIDGKCIKINKVMRKIENVKNIIKTLEEL